MEKSVVSRKSNKVGTVVSNAMDKSVTVKVESLVKHKLYHRFVLKSRTLMAHDERNECKVGDKIEITECRPLSRRKRWRVSQILERAS